MLSRERSLDEMEDVLCLRLLSRLPPPRLELRLRLRYLDSRRESRGDLDLEQDLLRLSPCLPRSFPRRARVVEALRLRLSLERLLRAGGLRDLEVDLDLARLRLPGERLREEEYRRRFTTGEEEGERLRPPGR